MLLSWYPQAFEEMSCILQVNRSSGDSKMLYFLRSKEVSTSPTLCLLHCTSIIAALAAMHYNIWAKHRCLLMDTKPPGYQSVRSFMLVCSPNREREVYRLASHTYVNLCDTDQMHEHISRWFYFNTWFHTSSTAFYVKWWSRYFAVKWYFQNEFSFAKLPFWKAIHNFWERGQYPFS